MTKNLWQKISQSFQIWRFLRVPIEFSSPTTRVSPLKSFGMQRKCMHTSLLYGYGSSYASTVQLDLNLSKNRVWCCTHTQYVQFQSRLALRVHAKLLTRILLAGTSRVSTRVPDVSSSACIIEYLERMQYLCSWIVLIDRMTNSMPLISKH